MIKKWLAHAFAVERPEDFTPTVEQQQIADRICKEIIRREMVTLAILTLETCRPLNYIGSQAIHFFTPLLSILVDPRSQKVFADFLEQRSSIEWLCQRLEFLSNAKPEDQGPPVDPAPLPVLKNDDS